MTEQQPKEKKNYWIWSTIILGAIVFLLMIGRNKPVINFAYIGAVLIIFIAFLIYKYVEKKINQLSYDQMITLCVKNEEKHGTYLNDNRHNIVVEPLGRDYFGVRFMDIARTYLISRGEIVGKSPKDLSILQTEFDRSVIRKTLAERGIKEVIE